MKNPPPLVTDLASVLESVQKLFNKEADCSTNAMDVHLQLQTCLEQGAAEGGDRNLVFDRAHQIMKKGLYDFLGSLQKIVDETVTKLATMARNHPEWTTEDPASWARSRIKELLDRWLDDPWHPQIAMWFHEALGGPDLDCTQHDSSWCAPTWAEESRELTNNPVNLDERITLERTEKLFKHWRHIFDRNLDRGLGEAEHPARVKLAMQPARLSADQPAAEAVTPNLQDRYLIQADRKMNDPDRYPTMTAQEAMAALNLSSSKVYDHHHLERVSTGTRAVRFTTKSVLAVKNSPPG